ncbi:MAG TPA: WGxxGxxG family protein [Sphingomicrobium sp.]|nr:WGxxGxxG family protein [Sphingomicrobium sp.]
MRTRILLSLLAVTIATVPASAQDNRRGGVPTETMARLEAANDKNDLIWNLIGLFGLVGLLGLGAKHPEDGYHPAPLD